MVVHVVHNTRTCCGSPSGELRLTIQDDFQLHEGKGLQRLTETLETLINDEQEFRFLQLFPKSTFFDMGAGNGAIPNSTVAPAASGNSGRVLRHVGRR